MDERALLELGREVAAEQDAALEERDDLRAVRARLLRRRARRWHVGRWVAAATLAAAAAGALISWGTRPAPPIGFEVAGEPGREGAWMAADETPRELRFSDGSRVELAPGAGLRVSALGPEGARLDLQRGSARVEVRHRSEDTRWAVHAGPFEVRVVGTAFDVSWDGERFALALEEGRVRISGPTLNERVVDAGETVRVALSERRVEIVQAEPAPAEPRTASARGAEPEPAPRVEERADAERAEARRPTPRRRARIDWRRLAREGRHADALEVADWDRVLATGGPEDLVLLGNAARLGGAPARARAALTALRMRHPGTPQAAEAAFLLGRLALGAGRAADAAAWFERAVAESPEGPQRMVAAGRRIEAYERAGNEIAARRAARSYLARHPEGPHAAEARRLVAETTPLAAPTRPARSAGGPERLAPAPLAPPSLPE